MVKCRQRVHLKTANHSLPSGRISALKKQSKVKDIVSQNCVKITFINTAPQNQKAVSVYLGSKQILHFGFAWQNTCILLCKAKRQ